MFDQTEFNLLSGMEYPVLFVKCCAADSYHKSSKTPKNTKILWKDEIPEDFNMFADYLKYVCAIFSKLKPV